MQKRVTASHAALAILVMSLATGCGTPHRPHMGPDQFREEPGPGGLVKVNYFGDGTVLMYQVQDFALYHCAEIARREGSPYFALYQTLPDALQNRTSSEVRPITVLGIPRAEVYISLRKTYMPGLLSTAEVLARLKPAVDRAAR